MLYLIFLSHNYVPLILFIIMLFPINLIYLNLQLIELLYANLIISFIKLINNKY